MKTGKAKDMETAVNSSIQKAKVTLAIETAAVHVPVALPFPLTVRDLFLVAGGGREIAALKLFDCSI
jgi:hypothetical protein